MQVKIIVITLGRIWKWSLNTGGLLIEVVFRSGLTVFKFNVHTTRSLYKVLVETHWDRRNKFMISLKFCYVKLLCRAETLAIAK